MKRKLKKIVKNRKIFSLSIVLEENIYKQIISIKHWNVNKESKKITYNKIKTKLKLQLEKSSYFNAFVTFENL